MATGYATQQLSLSPSIVLDGRVVTRPSDVGSQHCRLRENHISLWASTKVRRLGSGPCAAFFFHHLLDRRLHQLTGFLPLRLLPLVVLLLCWPRPHLVHFFTTARSVFFPTEEGRLA